MPNLKTTAMTTVALLGAMSAGATDIGFNEDVVNFSESAGQTGTLQVLVDTSGDGFTFQSLGMSVTSSNPGVIQITGATVFNPEFFGGSFQRWNAGTVTGMGDNGIDELLGTSVNALGLNGEAPFDANADGGSNTSFLFAAIDYVVIGEGSTSLSLGAITSRDGTFIVDEGNDVSGSVDFSGSQINVVPEPGSLALLGLGGLALLRRRR